MSNLLLALCFFAFDFLLMALLVFFRLLPKISSTTGRLMREFMAMSFRLYRWLLGRLAPYLQEQLGIDILHGTFRILSTVLLSLLVGLLVMGLTGMRVTAWGLLSCALHGLIVGAAWHTLVRPGEGLQLGKEVE